MSTSRMFDTVSQYAYCVIQVSGIDVMWDYLTSRKARLIKA